MISGGFCPSLNLGVEQDHLKKETATPSGIAWSYTYYTGKTNKYWEHLHIFHFKLAVAKFLVVT